MREKLAAFVADLSRFQPLAIVSLATLICLPCLVELLSGQVSTTSVLARFLLGLLLASLGVRVVSNIVVRYAGTNLLEAERRNTEQLASGSSYAGASLGEQDRNDSGR